MWTLSVTLAVLVMISASANGQSRLSPVSQSFTFGMVGLAPDQVARVNVVNPATPSTAGYACSATVSFLDGQGTVLKSQTFQVDPQKAVLLDLARSEIGGDGRVQIRAVMESMASGGGPDGQPILTLGICSPLATLEVFDRNTGRTTIFISEGRMVPLPLPSNGIKAPPQRPAVK